MGHSLVILKHQMYLVMFGLDWIVTYSLVIFPCVHDCFSQDQSLWRGHERLQIKGS